MPRENYSGASPYSKTFQTNWHIGLYEDRQVPPAGDDYEITIKPEWDKNPGLMSARLYGTYQYWWVFMQRNPNLIRDPIYDHKAGMTIWVPAAARLKKI